MDYQKLAKDYMEVLYQFRRHHTQRMIQNAMHGEGFLLYYMEKNGRKLTPGEISAGMGISSARVAVALNNLENKGLIVRSADRKDRRRTLVSLTPEGIRQVQEQVNQVMQTAVEMLAYLGEEDALHLIRIIKRMTEKFEEETEKKHA